jgi:hypothetical protein
VGARARELKTRGLRDGRGHARDRPSLSGFSALAATARLDRCAAVLVGASALLLELLLAECPVVDQ